MSQKRRIIKYLKPDVTKTVSNINKSITKPAAQKKNVTIAANYQEIPLANLINIPPKIKKSRVFVVGGGASLAEFDFSILQGEDIIAVNKAIEYVPYATHFITMDYTFITNKSKLTNADFDIIKNKAENSYFVVNLEHPYIKNINGVYTDTRMGLKYTLLNKFNYVIKSNKSYDIATGFGSDFHTFTHGKNSGYCGLQLAISLGYEEIYLLGYDLNVTSNKTHFHGGYSQSPIVFSKNLIEYRSIFAKSLQLYKNKSKIQSCTNGSYLNNFIKYQELNTLVLDKPKEFVFSQSKETRMESITPNTTDLKGDLRNLIIIGYYTVNTPYEQEAQGLINSCKKLNLRSDIVGVKSFGNWQSNTRFKARFMLDMLEKYPGQDLCYVDCDAVIHMRPELFKNYNCDISVRYQDFKWRQNECLSGTIFINSNERTIKLCKRWIEINEAEGPNAKTLEQWNLDKAIQEGIKNDDLKFKNLPPEYTFIFDSMRKMYPNARPVIEHFQASRRFRNQV